MGGIVIIGGMVVAYVVTRIRTPFTTAGLAVLGAAVGLGIVGAADDLLKIWRQRSLGLNKATKFVGQALVAVGFGLIAVHLSHVTTDISLIRPMPDFRLGLAFYVWVFVIVAASSNAVNLSWTLCHPRTGFSSTHASQQMTLMWSAAAFRPRSISRPIRTAAHRGCMAWSGPCRPTD
jgi:hypothetical protein